MAFFTGSPSFRRFRLAKTPPHLESPEYLGKIRNHAFQELTSAQERSIGWVSIHNFLDSVLSLEKVFKDRFLVLGLRIDQRSIPALLYKAHVDIEEKAALNLKGVGKLSQEEQKEIRERVKNKCLQHLNPSRKMYELVWDYKKKEVYFSGSSSTLLTEMSQLFSSTFGEELLSLDPIGLATLHLDKEQLRAFKELHPAHFIPSDFQSARSDKEFLGPEFLTWLWYKSEQEETLRVDSEPLQLIIYDHLQLVSSSGEEKVTVNGVSGQAKEAHTALLRGKKLYSVKLQILQGKEEWVFTLKAKTFEIKSVKTPAIEEIENTDRFLSKMYYLETLSHLLEDLYQQFLQKRLHPDWEKEELLQIQSWIQRRAGSFS